MRIEIEKDSSGNMINGWDRDLYETQHGKGDDKNKTEMLQGELASMRDELVKLKEENSQLRGDTIKSFKLGAARRTRQVLAELPPQLNLVRHVSEKFAHSGNDENVALPPLNLHRAKTTLAW